MKKLISLLLVVLFLVSFASCKNDKTAKISLVKQSVVYEEYYRIDDSTIFKLRVKNNSDEKATFSISGDFSKDFKKGNVDAKTLYACNMQDNDNKVFSLKANEEKSFIVWFDCEYINGGADEEKPNISFIEPIKEQTEGNFKYIMKNGDFAEITGFVKDKEEFKIPSKIAGYSVTRVSGFGNSKCKSVAVSEGIKVLSAAFCGCKNLESLVLPNSLEAIINESIIGCIKLKTINIPKNVCKIKNIVNHYDEEPVEAYPFKFCLSLEEINVDSENKTYGSVDGVLYDLKDKVLKKCPEAKKGSVKMPDWAKRIEYYDDLGQSAFANCTKITDVVLSKEFVFDENISRKVLFPNCKKLKSVTVDSLNKTLYSKNGAVYLKENDKKVI